MAIFKNTIVTDNGRNLIANALGNNRQITFTRMVTSNRVYEDTIDVSKLINLDGIKQTVNLSKVSQEDTKVKLNAVFTNASVNTSYRIETIGLYARIEGNSEVLYSVTRAKEADTMPATNGINLATVEIDLVTEINNSNGAVMQFNPSTLVTLSTIATEQSAGITKYGTEQGTALEGKRLSEIIGLEFGGNIQDVGQKTTGKFYYDTSTKHYFECVSNNNLTYVDVTKFKAISNKPISDKLENLSNFRQEEVRLNGNNGITQQIFRLTAIGNLRMISFGNLTIKNEYQTKFINLPEWFCKNAVAVNFSGANGTGGAGGEVVEGDFNPTERSLSFFPALRSGFVGNLQITGQCITVARV